MTTVAGMPGVAGALNSPWSVASDATGTTLWVADTGSHTLKQVAVSGGVVFTVAGSSGAAGYVNATGAAARFNSCAEWFPRQ